jgi:IS30 family transposase
MKEPVMRSYQQLTQTQRYQIAVLRDAGHTQKRIAVAPILSER